MEDEFNFKWAGSFIQNTLAFFPQPLTTYHYCYQPCALVNFFNYQKISGLLVPPPNLFLVISCWSYRSIHRFFSAHQRDYISLSIYFNFLGGRALNLALLTAQPWLSSDLHPRIAHISIYLTHNPIYTQSHCRSTSYPEIPRHDIAQCETLLLGASL